MQAFATMRQTPAQSMSCARTAMCWAAGQAAKSTRHAMPWLTTTPTKRRRALENLVTEQDLDTSYTALAEAIARVGQERAPLFLAMLALSLIARQPDTEQTLNLITQAEQNCTA